MYCPASILNAPWVFNVGGVGPSGVLTLADPFGDDIACHPIVNFSFVLSDTSKRAKMKNYMFLSDGTFIYNCTVKVKYFFSKKHH